MGKRIFVIFFYMIVYRLGNKMLLLGFVYELFWVNEWIIILG